MEEKNVNPHFISLVMMLASAAWQQLGKVPNPMTGKVTREIANAEITIDILAMLRQKMQGNLSPEEQKLLDNAVSDLQLNYVDELSKEHKQGTEEKKEELEEQKKEEVKPN